MALQMKSSKAAFAKQVYLILTLCGAHLISPCHSADSTASSTCADPDAQVDYVQSIHFHGLGLIIQAVHTHAALALPRDAATSAPGPPTTTTHPTCAAAVSHTASQCVQARTGAPKARVAPCRAFTTIESQNPYAEELKKVAQYIAKTGKGILVGMLMM